VADAVGMRKQRVEESRALGAHPSASVRAGPNSGGGGVGDDGGRMDGRGDRGRRASDGCGGGKGEHVSFLSTVGPLCLVFPGASLALLVGMQAQLIHSIDNRASSVAALQQSAGVGGRYHLGLLLTLPTFILF
jgi:hypothetical protein